MLESRNGAAVLTDREPRTTQNKVIADDSTAVSREQTAYSPATAAIVRKIQIRESIREEEKQECGRRIFEDWRRKYGNALAGALRLQDEMERTGTHPPEADLLPDKAENSVAYMILNFAADKLAHLFLTGTPFDKKRLTDAVLVDGGVTTPSGSFMEILP